MDELVLIEGVQFMGQCRSSCCHGRLRRKYGRSAAARAARARRAGCQRAADGAHRASPHAGDEEVQYILVDLPDDAPVSIDTPGTTMQLQARPHAQAACPPGNRPWLLSCCTFTPQHTVVPVQ